ncbi:uncharacterized protein LOC110861676 [Folsomia candida]|uniref:uncharacterized protein LOC110861676 n=1 Tax=Folsomia candida TaxID=158441 RepID=UPI000B8F4AF2|nr:uncharacterized protein LOC110861676 [Folsomia candida]
MAPTVLDKATSERSTTSDLIDYLETELTSHATTPLDEAHTSHLLSMVKACQTDVMEIHRKIQLASPPDMTPHQQEFQRLMTKSTKLLSAFTGIKMKFPVSSSASSSSAATSSTTPTTTDIRLPRLELPSFDGNLQAWVTFRDMFVTAVHDNLSLSKSQKLTYLKSLLKNEASRQISSMIISDTNYDIAWSQLSDRYQNDRELLFAILRRFHNQALVKPQSSTSIRSLVDVSRECIRSLDVLKLPTDQWDAHLLFILVTKMDSTSKELWEQSLKDSSIPSLKSLFEFLEQRARALAASGSLSSSSKPVHPNNPHGNRVQTRNMVHTTNASRNCHLCEASPHPLFKCEKFLGLPIQQRVDGVKKLNLCFNCFGPHRIQDCPSNRTCRTCNGKHHTLLHKPRQADAAAIPPVVLHAENSAPHPPRDKSHSTPKEYDTLLATCLVQVADPSGNYHTLRVLADNGSNANYVTDSCIKRIGVPRRRYFATATGLGGVSLVNATGITEFSVSPHFDSTISFFVSRCLITSKITGRLPSSTFDHSRWSHLQNLQLADPNYYKPQDIDMLLGAEFFFDILKGTKLKGPPNSPFAISTSFGWLIGGGAPNAPSINPQVHATLASQHGRSTNSISSASDQDEHLDATLRRFWEIESAPLQRLQTSDESKVESHFASTYRREENGQFTVQIPFKSQVCHPPPPSAGLSNPAIRVPAIGKSMDIAMKRLLYLERRLAKNPDHKKQYALFMKEYEDLGHMERVTPEDSTSACYIPHHFILKESSTTTSFRVVFDASAKTSNGVSLNDTMMVGPTIQDSLTDLLTRFRIHKIAFVADVAKMYRQILLSSPDREFHRILWREDPSKPVQHFRLRTVTYGTAAAPFLATRVLEEVATLEKDSFPRAAEVALRDFFVDDLMSGEPSVEEAIETQHQLIKMMESAKMSLRKWSSNSQAVLDTLPPEMRETQSLLNFDTDSSIKTLGIRWNPKADQFTFMVLPTPSTTQVTKRSILSEIARLFDLVGWLAPVIINGRIIMQSIWKLQQGWDESLPIEIHNQWNAFRTDLEGLVKLSINRYFLQGSQLLCPSLNVPSFTTTKYYLAGFCDASEDAYAAAVYFCAYDGQNSSISLVTSKTRVAPLKKISLPRLELCGASLLADLTLAVQSAVKVPIHSITAWTDSTVTLAWIRSDSLRWKTYVANRVTSIHEKIPPMRWGHVRGDENPADCASRGITVKDLIYHPLWWEGPPWLKNGIPDPQCCVPLNHSLAASEERKPKPTVFHSMIEFNDSILHRYSSLLKLVRITAFIFRFVKSFKCRQDLKLCHVVTRSGKDVATVEPRHPVHKQVRPESTKSTTNVPPLTPAELDQAFSYWIKHSQQQEFSKEIHSLANGLPIKKKSKLISLLPFIDSIGLLRVGGRLKNAKISEDQRHPILLSSHHHLTQLLIKSEHLKHFHAGPQLLMSVLQRRYWIIRMKDAVRREIAKCLTCTRTKAQTLQQVMADLPSFRVNPARPFLKCGVDYAGPFSVRPIQPRSKITLKAYLAVFVCCTTRAIHLEVATSLSTDMFIAAFRRFISRRGLPTDMYSDNGTNFIGANREMKEMVQLVNSSSHNQQVADNLSRDGIRWHWNPPAAPHFGGNWEIGVKSCKFHLKRIMGSHRLTFEELTTAACQIEAILNSRPLTPESNNPEDLAALTPGHFLIGAPLTAVPEPNLLDLKINSLSRWQLIQQMIQAFWKRWSAEYLSRLQQRPKWMSGSRAIAVGDIVVIKEENLPPCVWKLGRILALHPGNDSLVRVVTVKTSTGVFKRPIPLVQGRRNVEEVLTNFIKGFDLLCELVPNIAEACEPIDKMEVVLACDARYAIEPHECAFKKIRGVEYTNSTSSGGSVSDTFYTEISSSAGIDFKALQVMHTFIAKENHRLLQAQHEETLALRDTINHSQFTQTVTTGVLLAIVAVLGLCSLITNLASFETRLGVSVTTGYDWSQTESSTFTETIEYESRVQAPPGCLTRIKEAVGICGPFNVYSPHFGRYDYCNKTMVRTTGTFAPDQDEEITKLLTPMETMTLAWKRAGSNLQSWQEIEDFNTVEGAIISAKTSSRVEKGYVVYVNGKKRRVIKVQDSCGLKRKNSTKTAYV